MAKHLRAGASKILKKRFAHFPVPEKKFVDKYETAKLIGKNLSMVDRAISQGDIIVVKRDSAGVETKFGNRFKFVPKAEFMKLRRKYANYLTVPEALPIFEQGVGRSFSYSAKKLQYLIRQRGLFSKWGGGKKKIHIKDLLRLIAFSRRALEGQTIHQLAEKMGLPFMTLYKRIRNFLPEINDNVFKFKNKLYLPKETVKNLWDLHRKDSALLTVIQVQLELVKKGLYLDRSTLRNYFKSGKLSGKKSKMDNRRFLFDPKGVRAYIKEQLRKKKERVDFEKRMRQVKQTILPKILKKGRKALTVRDLTALLFFARTDEAALLHLKEVCRPEIAKNVYHRFFIRKGPEHNKDLAFSGLYTASVRFKGVFRTKHGFFRYMFLSMFGELANEHYPRKFKRIRLFSTLSDKMTSSW